MQKQKKKLLLFITEIKDGMDTGVLPQHYTIKGYI